MQHLKRGLQPDLPGSTLLELCTVIMLLGFIVSLSIGFYSGSTTLVRLELNRLYAALVYVRRKAILEGRIQRVSFTQRSFTLNEELPLAHPVLFEIPPRIKGPPGNPTNLLKKAITFKNQFLEAYPDGTLSSGALYLTDDIGSCLFALTTDASAVTGIRRYRYRASLGLWEALE